MLAACAREADEAGYPRAVSRPPGARRGDARALRSRPPRGPHRRRLRSPVDRRARTGRRSDRGAAQLLEQTRFLSAAFRRYESRLAECGRSTSTACARVISRRRRHSRSRHLVIAVGDRPCDADGFWPADVTLFTTVPGLARSTSRHRGGAGTAVSRSRAARLRRDRGRGEPATAADADVGRARTTRRRDGVRLPRSRRRARGRGEASRHDARPTAAPRSIARAWWWRGRCRISISRARYFGGRVRSKRSTRCRWRPEPYAAAVDVVLECAAANFTRRALLALLRSPHFRFVVDGAEVDRSGSRGLDRGDGGRALSRRPRSTRGARRVAGRRASSGHGVGRARRRRRAGAAARAARPLADQRRLLRQFLERSRSSTAVADDRRRRAPSRRA